MALTLLPEGARLLADAKLGADTQARLLRETAAEIESRSLRSSPLHLASWLLLGATSATTRNLPAFVPFAVALAVVLAVRIGVVLWLRTAGLPGGRTRGALYQVPWLLAAVTFSASHTWASVHTLSSWEPIIINAVAGLGGVSSIVFFSPYGRGTLAYVLILTVPTSLGYVAAQGLQGPGLASLFMFIVFLGLVLPMLTKAHADYWLGLISTALLEEHSMSLQKQSEEKSAFLAHMSHELRTPLNGILGVSQAMLDASADTAPGAVLEGEQRNNAETIQSSARSLLVMLNELLAAARLEARREVVDLRAFAPGPTVLEAAELFRRDAEKKGLTLSVRLEELPGAALGDRGRLRQVIVNLVHNAVRFTDTGRVDVVARVVPGTAEAASATGVGDPVLEVQVTDTGRGIAAEDRGRLFVRFSQLDRGAGGTGLGLWISRGLVELLGGELNVDSAGRGRGSTFWFRVPLRPAPSESTALHARVLLVDDDAVNRRVGRAMLESLGCTVIEATHGLEALATLQRVPVDVVLIDLQMPDVDGITATRMIRASGSGSLPILALTASADAATRARCLEAGLDDVLEKPTTPAALEQALVRFTSPA